MSTAAWRRSRHFSSAQLVIDPQGGSKQQHRARLVRRSQRQRNHKQQCGNTQAYLYRQHNQQQAARETSRSGKGQASGSIPENWNQDRQRPRNHAMIELHGRHVVEEVAIPGLQHEYFRRYEMAIHEREGIVSKTRADTRDEASG